MELILANRPKAPKAPSGRSHQSKPSLSAKPRVLIVEDEWIVGLDLESEFLDAGYEVVGVAVTAEEAVAMAAEHKPDIVTMDVRLHGARDGVTTAIELYRDFGLRCLFVSAYDNASLKEQAVDAHPLGWLRKPVPASQVVSAVGDALRKQRKN